MQATTFASVGRLVRIGDWQVDPAANELTRAGVAVRIEPKAMAVLMALACAPGRVLGRTELLAQVWPAMVVGDEALTQTIIKLRRALGDHPRTPAFIETISKRGYRLIAPVDWVDAPGGAGPIATADVEDAACDAIATPKSASPADRRPRDRWPRRLAVALALAGTLLVGLGVTAYFEPQPDPGEPARSPGATGQVDLPRPADRTPDAPTVTVLPFDSVGAGDHAYLARGLGNDLMTDLSRLPGVRLIRASGQPAGGRAASAARHVVSGSVQRDGDTLRINIHLVDTASGEQLWSERFERPFGDLFTIQDEIVRRLTELLPGKLNEAAHQRQANRHTRSLPAYDLLLRAQAQLQVRQPDANEEARRLFQQALALDPQFARAYAGLAITHAMDYRLRPPDETATALTRALELAESARQIDPESPEVHWALAFVHVQARRHEQAIEHLNKAIDLNPSFADAHAFIGGILGFMGQSAKAIASLRTAFRLNPEGSYLYFQILGRSYLFEDDVEQALINLRAAASRNPVDLETRVFLSAALAAAGDADAARWEAAEIRALAPGFSTDVWLQTYPLRSEPYRQRLLALLAGAGL